MAEVMFFLILLTLASIPLFIAGGVLLITVSIVQKLIAKVTKGD